MTWNYRIVRYRDNKGFGLHEVYYDSEGRPWSMTVEPATFACDVDEGPEGVRGSLLMARVDAIKRPVLDVPDVWPGEAPHGSLPPGGSDGQGLRRLG